MGSSISLHSHFGLSLKLPPVESVVSICSAVSACAAHVFFLEMYCSSEINVVGNLNSLSETLSFLASLNFWSMCPNILKPMLNNWPSLLLLRRLNEQWPSKLLRGQLSYILPPCCCVYCSRWLALLTGSETFHETSWIWAWFTLGIAEFSPSRRKVMEGLYTLICQVGHSPVVPVKGIQACGSMQEQQLIWH